jgi:hypothetical protein
MRSGSIRTMAAGMLLLVPAGCASTQLSTRDIYSELAFTGEIVCTPVAVARVEQRQDDRFNERIAALSLWLIAEIGRAELTRMQNDYDEEMATVYFTSQCPSDEEHSHRRTRRWMLLHELESRARIGPIDHAANSH